MLSKNQIESMTQCKYIKDCQECVAYNSNVINFVNCLERTARTALAYRTLLEEAAEEIENCYGRETTLSQQIREAISDAKQE